MGSVDGLCFVSGHLLRGRRLWLALPDVRVYRTVLLAIELNRYVL